jgi:hypothetical protein
VGAGVSGGGAVGGAFLFFSSLSYTPRALGRRSCVGRGSWAHFDFPIKHFVWGFRKIGPPPYKPSPGLHFFGDLVAFALSRPAQPQFAALRTQTPTLRRAPGSDTHTSPRSGLRHPHFAALRAYIHIHYSVLNVYNIVLIYKNT